MRLRDYTSTVVARFEDAFQEDIRLLMRYAQELVGTENVLVNNCRCTVGSR